MPSTHKSLRSSTANKRPTTAIADGQIAMNTNVTSPGLFFKDSAGTVLIKIGPVHVGTTAPNVSPAAGGSTGNSTGEAWLDTSLTPNGWKVWTGAAWLNATPAGSDTVQGLLELATNAETQAGSDTARAVTPAGLQSKVSDSTSTTSSTTIASSTAVKAAYDLANAALPKSGGTVTGNLEIGNTGSLTFEGATADAFETTLAVVDPTADRTITLPNVTGTVVTTGDTGSVTSTMILDGTILNADVNASAAIAGTKISPDFGSQNIVTTGVFSHALGTAGAPTITFTGDTNTGIYSPAADTLAFVEGGVEALRIDSSGRVGIGTTSPGAKLTVVDTAGGEVLRVQGQNGGAGGSVNLGIYCDSYTGPAQVTFGTRRSTTALADFGRLEVASEDGVLVNGSMRFYTASSNVLTERARIDSSGRMGIGTSNIQQRVTILDRSAAVSAGSTVSIVGGTNNVAGEGGSIAFSNQVQAGTTHAARIRSFLRNSAAQESGDLFFDTNAGSGLSAQLRITHTGEIHFQNYIANSGNVGTAFIPGAANTDYLRMLSAGTGAATLVIFGNNNGGIGSITTVGSSTSFNTSSDYRLKENIEPVSDGITRLQQLKPSRFNFKADPDKIVDGFIAHEAQAVVPECVTGEKDAEDDDGNPVYQGIDQSKLVPLLTAALQEAIAKIETLEARLTAAGIA